MLGYKTPGRHYMKRYDGLSRGLISISLVIALLGVAVCVGSSSSPSLAKGIPETDRSMFKGGRK